MSYLNNVLAGKKVLVTGATGFVGGRLAERLAVEEKAIVMGTGRRLEKASYLQDVGVRLMKVDLMDEAALKTAVSGQELVFHVAAWVSRNRDEKELAYALNVTATEQLMRFAADAGVKRFLYVSSIAAYGPPQQDVVTEAHPLNLTQDNIYGVTKAQGELAARKLADETGLELTILRPALVYGPGSISWTLRMFKLVRDGVPVIFGGGKGYAYPVYIDNLVDGMLLMGTHPAAAGEAFQFSDETITWHQLFTYYGNMCDRRPRRLPLFAANLMVMFNRLFKLGLPLTRDYLDFYLRQIEFPATKAKEMLGYAPRVSLDEGMAAAESWLRAAGHLRPS